MATKLDLADAQFIGFYNGKWNSHNILFLVEGMCFTIIPAWFISYRKN